MASKTSVKLGSILMSRRPVWILSTRTALFSVKDQSLVAIYLHLVKHYLKLVTPQHSLVAALFSMKLLKLSTCVLQLYEISLFHFSFLVRPNFFIHSEGYSLDWNSIPEQQLLYVWSRTKLKIQYNFFVPYSHTHIMQN